MSKLIEYDDAIERLGAYLMADAQIEWGGIASENIEDWKEIATDILKGSPNIDIVRCKECKWDKAQMIPKEVKCIYQHNADDFCSYGERSRR